MEPYSACPLLKLVSLGSPGAAMFTVKLAVVTAAEFPLGSFTCPALIATV